MQGINLLTNAWTLSLADWVDLKRGSEVYTDIKSGLQAGERYVVRDQSGAIMGLITLDNVQELRINFMDIISKN